MSLASLRAGRRDAIRVACVVIAAVAVSSCNPRFPMTPTAEPTRLVLLNRFSLSNPFQVGTTAAFEAFLVSEGDVYEDVTRMATWTASSPAVVQQSTPGFFFGLQPGTVEVTATHRGFRASEVITVDARPTTQPYLSMSTSVPETRVFLTLVTTDRGVTRRTDVTAAAQWASSNPQVATVAAGQLTPVSTGVTILTASFENLTTSARVSVYPRQRVP